ncbi:EAL domain-containing protein [Terribacillus saccharophilus]|uniref:putative bifunctional diguanylate cyclase/phosphodiesterase n=1 Tax=Terribacillus saccharophilus TaxID=361277 RepID=UPI0039829F09
MERTKKKNTKAYTSFVFIFLLFSAVYLFLFRQEPRELAIGSGIIAIIGSALPAFWSLRAYQAAERQVRKFWLFLSLALLSCLIATMSSYFYEFYFGMNDVFISVADVLWNAAIIFSLLAFLYLIKQKADEVTIYEIVYDAVIIIVAAACISWEFLQKQTWEQLSQNSFIMQLFGISHPAGDLIVLFFLVCVFNALSYQRLSKALVCIYVGFLLFLISDTIFLYLASQHMYYFGHPIDWLGTASLLIIGGAAFFAEDLHVLSRQEAYPSSTSLFSARLWFSNVSVLVLLALIVARGDGFDLIAFGCIVSTLLIIFRQMHTMFQNRKLMLELEGKVLERTEELIQKNKELEASTERAEFLAGHDPLTGLPNRREFDRIASEWVKTNENGFALLFMDMDRFKWVNDTMNHGAGDLLLRKVAKRLLANVGAGASVFRQGGDEFLVLLPVTEVPEIDRAVCDLIQSLEQVFFIHDNEVFISASVGISLYPEHTDDVELLTIKADIAMYAAKKSHGKQWLIYDETLLPAEQSKLELEKEMRYGLERGEFCLHFQPLYHMDSETVSGAEVLMRWQHPKRGLLYPNSFIPLAEESRFIIPLGRWMIREACRQWRSWQEQGYEPISLAVNISVNQFLHPDFLTELEEALQEHDMDPAYLELEITENIPFSDTYAIAILEHIKQLGIRISIDDFGTGYSSLQYIQRLPVHTLKIDRSFVHDMMHNRNNKVLVETILMMAKQLNLEVIAEGVEEQDQLAFLKDNGCAFVQGYLIGKPVEEEIFRSAWLYEQG